MFNRLEKFELFQTCSYLVLKIQCQELKEDIYILHSNAVCNAMPTMENSTCLTYTKI